MSDGRPWITCRVFPGPLRDAAIAAMFDAGVQGVHELGDTLVTHVPDQAAAACVSAAMTALSANVRVETESVPDVDWSVHWKDGIRAQTVGAFQIAPPWLSESLDPSRRIIIDPGMAFGTGDHATTRGAIRLLQGVVRPGDHVADLGAGSGILAIAAAKLGAARVAAIELDPDAIGNAEANVALNGVSGRVAVIEGDAAVLLDLVAPVQVITANIISSVLVALLPACRRTLSGGGHVILSGMLASERPEMIRLVTRAGWRVVAEDHEDAWWSATITLP